MYRDVLIEPVVIRSTHFLQAVFIYDEEISSLEHVARPFSWCAVFFVFYLTVPIFFLIKN